MKLKRLFIVILVGILSFIPSVYADNEDIKVKSLKVIDSSEGIDAKESDEVNVTFDDLDQYIKYEVVLENTTNKDLYLNTLKVKNSSEEFIHYVLDDKSVGKKISSKDDGKATFYIKTLDIKQAGRNVNDEVNLKFLFGDSITKNPATNNNRLEIILSIILISGLLYFIFSKKKKKINYFIICIGVILCGVTSVMAKDEIFGSIAGKVKYTSQNLMETSGTSVAANTINYSNSKDVWTYYDKVKNIYIKSNSYTISKYYKKFDLTNNDKNRVVGYLVENNDSKVPYDLYIVSRGIIYAPNDSTGLFSFPNVEKIEGLENVEFEDTEIFKGMFMGNEKLSSVNVSSMNVEEATDVSYMFYMNYKLDVSKDTLKLSDTVNKENMYVQYLYDEVKKDAKSDKDIDFSKVSSSTNGEGVYLRSGTENYKNPIYYYRGNVTNNNVKFGNYCWKMVRTTETGGIKLIYNGVPTSSGYCSNTGSYTRIGTSEFNSVYDSPAYVGYMYGAVYNRLIKSASQIPSGTVYGNDIEYKDGKYYLKDTYISENGWATDYTKIGEKYHYTCFSNESSCETVNYIYYAGAADNAYYIPLTGGKTQLNLLDEMLTNSTNENSSTIKGIIDSWYSTNMINYTAKLEDTVWCNDRSINQLNGWDKDKKATSYLNFGGYGRLVDNKKPSLECSNPNDRFTVNNANGNGKLTYPVALLTADEVVLAGAKWQTSHSNFYLYTGQSWWALSPTYFTSNNAHEFPLDSAGYLNSNTVRYSLGVRPSISLKKEIDYISGDGTVNNPYIINDKKLIYDTNSK